MRNLGRRKRRRPREKGRRHGQDVMTVATTWGGSGSNWHANPNTSIETPAVADSPSNGGHPSENPPPPNPNPTDTLGTTSPGTSTEVTDDAWGATTTTVASAQGTLATPDLHMPMSGNPGIGIQQSSITGSDDLGVAVSPAAAINGIPDRETSAVITSNQSSSLMSTFTLTDASQTTHLSDPTNTSAAAPSTTQLPTTLASPTDTMSSTSLASALPQVEHKGGTRSTNAGKTIAGATVGTAVLILLILLAILAYVRGGAMRGLCLNTAFPPFHSKKKKRNAASSATPVNQSEENLFRREPVPITITQRDLENARGTTGSRYSDDGGDDDDESWHEIDVRDALSGHLEKDNGEWLESWHRGKVRMMSTRRGPNLHFNPALPLPPITWDEEKRISGQ